jgi:hypothetical protein
VTSAAVVAATTVLPRPRAISAPVKNDVSSRTLVVSRPRDCSGHEAFMWRQAWERLANREERGWATNLPVWAVNDVPTVWCSAPGHSKLVAATPGENLTLRFAFQPGTPESKVYGELVSKPGLSALVTVDRGTLYFLGVKLFNRS